MNEEKLKRISRNIHGLLISDEMVGTFLARTLLILDDRELIAKFM